MARALQAVRFDGRGRRIDREGHPLCEAEIGAIPGELCRSRARVRAGGRALCAVHAHARGKGLEARR